MGRRIVDPEVLPGMPDTVAGTPAKADSAPPLRTLDEAIARAHDIIGEALDRYPIKARQVLYSGGNDSSVLLDLVGRYLDSSANDAIVHVNTGIGIEETRDHVRATAATSGIPYRELSPRDSYEDLILGNVIARTGPNAGVRPVWKGFPGPAGHRVMYRRLKNEPLMRNRAEIIGDRGRTEKVMYLGGMRWDESDARFRNAEEIDPEGAIIWVSPIVHFTNAQMREYRERFAVPRNPVSEHLHLSGECLCGAYAKPGELDEIEFFYPKAAYRIRGLEQQAQAAGIAACKWGQAPPGNAVKLGAVAGRLCTSCVAPPEGQMDLMDYWREQGLLPPEPVPAVSGDDVEVAAP